MEPASLAALDGETPQEPIETPAPMPCGHPEDGEGEHALCAVCGEYRCFNDHSMCDRDDTDPGGGGHPRMGCGHFSCEEFDHRRCPPGHWLCHGGDHSACAAPGDPGQEGGDAEPALPSWPGLRPPDHPIESGKPGDPADPGETGAPGDPAESGNAEEPGDPADPDGLEEPDDGDEPAEEGSAEEKAPKEKPD